MAENDIIEGTGTENDPYIITKMSELYEKAGEDNAYLRIHNDINITDEYPNGDMPTLNIKCHIDGNGKKISNWYKTNGNVITKFNATTVHDLTFSNIYCPNSMFVDFYGGNANYHFVNCKFRGVVREFFQAVDDYGSTRNFSSCAFNIKTNYYMVINNWSYIGIRYCRIKYTSDSTASALIGSCRSWDNTFDSCYIDVPFRIGNTNDRYINCVCNLTTTQTFTLNGNSSDAKNIVNSTHAPNVTVDSSGSFVLVSDSDWLNTNYLRSVGFNAG